MDAERNPTVDTKIFPETHPAFPNTTNENEAFKESQNFLVEDFGQCRWEQLSIFTILSSASFEIFSLVLAGTSLFGLVVLLLKHDRKERPTWYLGSERVSINAIVSVVSTIFRGCLMAAVSRSIGQACWLWYRKPRSLGDVCYYDDASRGSSLGCATLLKKLRLRGCASLGAAITLLALALDPFFQQSVEYISMTVKDTTRDAQSVAAHTYDAGVEFFDFETPSLSLPYNISCTFESVEDTVLQPMLQNMNPELVFIIESRSTNELDNATLEILRPYANTTGFLAMTQWVKATGSLWFGSPYYDGIVYPNTTFEAGRCFFYLSVQKINAAVRNGKYSENIIHEWTQAQNGLKIPTYTSNDTKYYFRNINEINYDTTPIVYNIPGDKSRPMYNNTFVVPWSTYLMIASKFIEDGFLNGNATGNTADTAAVTSNNVLPSTKSNDTHTLQQSENATFQIAPTQVVTGTVWMQKQIVVVRWGYLSLPVSLLILAVILFMATYMKTRKCQAGLWGSSPLTLFFHGRLQNVSPNFNWNPDALNTEKEMEKVASGLRAKLAPNRGGAMEVWECS
ncbi:hypothetical protein NHQ30_006618 [Ciborinia camelliae]|nr:hypothetical protein NHQ30_006618 [Ciborinia camelliae]